MEITLMETIQEMETIQDTETIVETEITLITKNMKTWVNVEKYVIQKQQED
jgi:hypothetical protein